MTITDPTTLSDNIAALRILTPEAVRLRAHYFLDLARNDKLRNFGLREELLTNASDHVVGLLQTRFPDHKVPFHARWRHFVVDGLDRATPIFSDIENGFEKARAKFDLAITSVLLDAGAGTKWQYRDGTGHTSSRSEGLAMASLEMFANGQFSESKNDANANAEILFSLNEADLARAFQVTSDNPLTGLGGRAALLSALGKRVIEAPDYFPGKLPRPGNLFDYLLVKANNNILPAREILVALLLALGPIWPDRLSLGGLSLGDTWRHDQAKGDDIPDGYIPFHKLSQWLAYSLIEPLQDAGMKIVGVNDLTGLAEYRNGGLFVDYGIIAPKAPSILTDIHAPDSDVIIEWRALTVALLDNLAAKVRGKLELNEEQLPLASVLEAGSWAAGREIAQTKRSDGGSPIAIAADGTVF